MNNANCYALENKARYIYDSDSEQQYQFLGNNIVRTQKSMSMISQKPHKAPRNAQMKKSNSFLLSTKPQTSQHKVQVESKDKSKTSTKKCLNVTEVRKKPPINSKNSMTKTSVSIGNASTKSIKSVKNKSLSRDYLIIDEQIYQCDNIEEINEKLICGSSSMYSHERFIKATLKNQQKLEKYILSFAQFCTFRKKSRPCLPELSISQKKKLYQLLKSQTTDNSINSHKQIPRQQISIQSLIKQAYHKIEQKSIQIIRQKPEQEVSIRKWKNGKLHQLMEMHTCLKEEVEEIEQVDVRQIFQFQKNGEQIRGLMVKSEDKGLSLEFNQNNNNQMSEKNYNFSIKSHETDDKFPEHPKFKTLDNFHAPGYLPQDHNLSKAGIQSFLQSLWNYLVDSDKIGELISHILQPFGYSNSQKLQLLRNKNQVLPYKSSISQQIIPNSIFISLCKANPIEQGSQDDKKSLIIFQKAVFDAFNQQITKFQTDFPFGSYHPLENNNNNAFYFIDQSNVMIVWEQCMEAVYQNNCIGLGKIKQIDETGQFGNEDKQFKQWMKQESKFYEWEIAKPLARRNLLEQLIGQIEQIIFSQAGTQFSNF